MNTKMLVFVICVEAITYLLLYNLDGCTFIRFFYKTEIVEKTQKESDLILVFKTLA